MPLVPSAAVPSPPPLLLELVDSHEPEHTKKDLLTVTISRELDSLSLSLYSLPPLPLPLSISQECTGLAQEAKKLVPRHTPLQSTGSWYHAMHQYRVWEVGTTPCTNTEYGKLVQRHAPIQSMEPRMNGKPWLHIL